MNADGASRRTNAFLTLASLDQELDRSAVE
jgi:hypothetical protein